MEDNSKKKKELEQLRNSEKKYQAYIQRRNELNDLAKVLREERDMVNQKHKEISRIYVLLTNLRRYSMVL